MKKAMCCLAVVLSACSSSAREDAAAISAADPPARRSIATPTLDNVRGKDFVQCGVTTGVAGFSAPNAQGEWRGLDVDVCRAIAAAVLGDASKVKYTPLSAKDRFEPLKSGESKSNLKTCRIFRFRLDPISASNDNR